MKNYIKSHEWCVIEEGFHGHDNEITESLMSLGNGRMGQRGNFEEHFSGKTLQGNYVAGVYYPDKTRVGWWKNGYPEYFAKVLNACNWIGIDIEINGQILDLNTCEVTEFRRTLNMKEGTLARSFVAKLGNGNQIAVETMRFCSIVDDEAGAIRYQVTPINFDGEIVITPYLDGDVSNKDANYGEKFWDEVRTESNIGGGYVELKTKKTAFYVGTATRFEVEQNGQKIDFRAQPIKKQKYVGSRISLEARRNEPTTLYKYAVNLSSMNYEIDELFAESEKYVQRIQAKGFEQLRTEQKLAWEAKWNHNDIVIEGDVAAQQAIRFNIFQLEQTYTGEDQRLNIGPKGFTGEKYGGSTYWDTEAYCLPFYLATADQKVARNLLVYRHKHLQKAIENAEKLGFKNGAALYPMVTMNGEECHNEWEITFEEIHRNGAIAYAIYDYVRYTADATYLPEYGLEVLVAISRFWAQRVNWSGDKQKYVMLGVTGPNEYENNVNNNWYTNYIAAWTLRYTLAELRAHVAHDPQAAKGLLTKTNFDFEAETEKWQDIIENMYLPHDAERNVFLQQDGFLDKELLTVDDIADQRPINQGWSWDRILRSCFIKQADVLQGLYFFEDEFDEATLQRNFDFYEPMTVHESSLSPCVHAIQAAKLGRQDKAYEMYLRTARLDLDDYNNDTEDGLHITSMAGTWLAVVKGFGGMRVLKDQLYFSPFLPDKWQSFAFRIGFRGSLLRVAVNRETVEISNLSEKEINVSFFGENVLVEAGKNKVLEFAMN